MKASTPFEQPLFFSVGSPTSINALYRVNQYTGKPYLTKAGKTYKLECQMMLRSQIADADIDISQAFTQPVSIAYVWFRPANRGDLDNISKLLWDSMQGILFKNDSQVFRRYDEKSIDRENPRVDLLIAYGQKISRSDMLAMIDEIMLGA